MSCPKCSHEWDEHTPFGCKGGCLCAEDPPLPPPTARDLANAALDRAHDADSVCSLARRRRSMARAVYEDAVRALGAAKEAADTVWKEADDAEDAAVAAGFPDRRKQDPE